MFKVWIGQCLFAEFACHLHRVDFPPDKCNFYLQSWDRWTLPVYSWVSPMVFDFISFFTPTNQPNKTWLNKTVPMFAQLLTGSPWSYHVSAEIVEDIWNPCVDLQLFYFPLLFLSVDSICVLPRWEKPTNRTGLWELMTEHYHWAITSAVRPPILISLRVGEILYLKQ